MNKDIAYIIGIYLPDSETRCAYAQVSTQTYKATNRLPNVLSNGKRHGLCKKYYYHSDSITTEQLWHEDNYKDGKKHGLCKIYRESGELNYETNYKDGEPHGLCKHYYESGVLCYEGNYKDGKRHGLYKSYYQTGESCYEHNYKDGIKQ